MQRWWRWIVAVVLAAGLTGLGVERLIHPLSDSMGAAWQTGPALQPSESGDLIARLQAENATLRQQIHELSEILHAAPQTHLDQTTVRAQVVARPLHPGRRFVALGVGRGDGIELGRPVCAGWTMVGVVEGIADSQVLVRAVIDRDSRVPCRIVVGEDSFVDGVWSGTGRRDRAEVRWVEEREGLSIAPGSAVITAGGNGIPTGLVLGTVVQAIRPERTAQPGGHWRIDTAPGADLAAQSWVYVLK